MLHCIYLSFHLLGECSFFFAGVIAVQSVRSISLCVCVFFFFFSLFFHFINILLLFVSGKHFSNISLFFSCLVAYIFLLWILFIYIYLYLAQIERTQEKVVFVSDTLFHSARESGRLGLKRWAGERGGGGAIGLGDKGHLGHTDGPEWRVLFCVSFERGALECPLTNWKPVSFYRENGF